jgi:hypothetical protein
MEFMQFNLNLVNFDASTGRSMSPAGSRWVLRWVLRCALPAMAVLLLSCAPRAARADDFKVISPAVVAGERELEAQADTAWNAGARAQHEDTLKLAAGYGVAESWFTELELEWERAPGGPLARSATAWENVLQLTEPGRYWLDAGLFAELEAAAQPHVPNVLVLGPLLQKQAGRMLVTLNALLQHDFGADAAPGSRAAYAGQLRWLLSGSLQPALEAFGEPHEQRAGPAVLGTLHLGRAGLAYELGYLAGLTRDAPKHTLKASLELEF